jgi:hypothetical protein
MCITTISPVLFPHRIAGRGTFFNRPDGWAIWTTLLSRACSVGRRFTNDPGIGHRLRPGPDPAGHGPGDRPVRRP